MAFLVTIMIPGHSDVVAYLIALVMIFLLWGTVLLGAHKVFAPLRATTVLVPEHDSLGTAAAQASGTVEAALGEVV